MGWHAGWLDVAKMWIVLDTFCVFLEDCVCSCMVEQAGNLVVVLLLFKNGGKLLLRGDRIVGFFDFFQ